MLKLVSSKKDCVIVFNTETSAYKVVDIELDVICMTKDYDKAENVFNNYDIEAVRRERKAMFDKWLKDNVK
jgi:hypothetical protein